MAPEGVASLRKFGPVPANRGGQLWDQKGRHAIVQIFASFENHKILSLQFQYVEEDGSLSLSEIFGNQEFVGSGFVAWRLDYPSEYIVFVGGLYSDLGIEEISIRTNKKGIIVAFDVGSQSETSKLFSYDLGYNDPNNELQLNQFGGFHGTCDSECITSIGVYFKPVMMARTFLRV